MRAPGWTRWLLTWLAGNRAGEVVGDLEESHRARLAGRGGFMAVVLTSLEALDMAVALLRLRWAGGGGRSGAERPGEAARRRIRPISWLDVKLGMRLLVKHPGLSVVSVVGMMVAVAIGASAFSVIRGMTSSPLPLHEGDRVVAVQNVGPLGLSRARGTHLQALESWREVPALEGVGAFRIVTRNVATPDGAVVPTRVAEMTASGFRLARVPPLLGRTLIDADESPGAGPVVVIGHGVWQERFGGAADVLGRTVRIGATSHAIVGVMPRGFAFPVNDRLWTPLRLRGSDYPIGEAPAVQVFARLSAGADLDEAAAQLSVSGERWAAENPATHADLRPYVGPYTEGPKAGPMGWFLYLVQLFVIGLLVVIAINVAALVYARTATRSGEIAVRTALGAGRGRIAGQLFAESFVLSVVAAAAGLLLARVAVERVELYVTTGRSTAAPFWWDFGLTPATVLYAGGLAVLAAAIIGVVPALGSTGRRLRAGLQTAGASSAGPPLGRTWTALIVAQIAMAVAVLPVGMSGLLKWGLLDAVGSSAYPLDEVLIAELALDAQTDGGGEAVGAGPRYVAARMELRRRVEALGEVRQVAVMETAPWEDPDLPFELEGAGRRALPGTPQAVESASSGHRIGRSVVSSEFFETFDIQVVAGRGLTEKDGTSPDAPVVVNRAFVDLILGGASPLGRRFRFVTEHDATDDALMENRWHTVVGVIPNFPPSTMSKPEATAYQAMAPGETGSVSFAIRVRDGEPERLTARLRQVGAEVDPMLRLERMETLATDAAREKSVARLTILTVALLALAVMLLAVAGLYALMSFTVARRQREIGIRTALGARPHRVIQGVLARAARQLAVGVSLGLVLAFGLDRMAGGEILGGRELLVLPAVAALMGVVGILSAWAPTRRGLRVQPTEALRAD